MPDLYSAVSASATGTPVNTSWWLKDLTDSTRNKAVAVVEWQPVRKLMAGEFFPRGRTEAVVASGDVYGISGNLSLRVLNEVDYTAVILMLTSKRTLLLQSVLGQQWWVRVSGDIQENLVRAKPSATEVTPISWVFEVTTKITQVKALT